ncbi:MAG: ATP-dependent endonuclease [Fimbriimonadales bacterium]
MKPLRLELHGHRSVDGLAFDIGALTVLFGKNNAGKTNILEAVLSLVGDDDGPLRRPVVGRDSSPLGGMWVQLEPGVPFDDGVASAAGLDPSDGPPRLVRLGRSQVLIGDPYSPGRGSESETLDEVLWGGQRGAHQPGPSVHVLFLDWQFESIHDRFAECIERLTLTEAHRRRNDWPWLESIGEIDGSIAYRVPPHVESTISQLGALASDLLPDFVEGTITPTLTSATAWHAYPKVILEFHEYGATQCPDVIELAGSGAARWMAAAMQVAIHVLSENDGLTQLRDLEPGALSGHLILLDEPEAHLHPSAVASVVRWCHRLVRAGATVIVATHHEEFLRSSDAEITLVHVTRDADMVATNARTLTSTASSALQELALDVGMHPATALSLHRAVLFVEGPLDIAVLDEYAGLRLDAAGVLLVPIHGTKNLEGIVSGEIITRLGLALGILTDATDPDTMRDRSGRRRSSEERKVLRILDLARDQGLPAPAVFGVPEADLLFALPRQGIEVFLGHPFPEWNGLVQECRAALGATPSESVNWKQYALDRYGLPITDSAGVRELTRFLDLAGTPLPSIEEVVGSIEQWAASTFEAGTSVDGP